MMMMYMIGSINYSEELRQSQDEEAEKGDQGGI
jgi:hypothetical protein